MDKRKKFWDYIEKAMANHAEEVDKILYLTNLLKEESDEEIFNFGIILDELLLESYNDKMWCASYLVNADISEDSFDFFRLWLISRGEMIFKDVLENPDNLIKYIGKLEIGEYREDLYENEDFFFIAPEAYALKNKETLEDTEDFFENYLDAFDEYKENIGYVDVDYPKIKFSWNEKEPRTMYRVCPKLYNRMYLED